MGRNMPHVGPLSELFTVIIYGIVDQQFPDGIGENIVPVRCPPLASGGLTPLIS